MKYIATQIHKILEFAPDCEEVMVMSELLIYVIDKRLIEMVLDWKAASERGEESVVNISASVKRFDISEQTSSVIINTLNSMGWKHC
jgi:hypothetical protein